MESIVAHVLTLEADFASLLFSIDGLRHVMFRGIPVRRDDDDGDYHINKSDLVVLRIAIFDGEQKSWVVFLPF